MQTGWVKLYRKSIDSRVFSDAELWKLWTWCLMRANHADRYFQGILIPRGSFVMGYRSAAETLGIASTTLHRQFKKLSVWKEIELKAERDFTVVTICNYEIYNGSSDDDGTQLERDRNASETPAERQRDADGTKVEPSKNYQELQEPKELEKSPPTPQGEQPPEPDHVAEAWREFAAAWNKTPGVVKCQAGNESRRKSFRARLKERVLVDGKPTPWIDAALVALQRHFPLKICESDPAGWKPDIDFFLRPASVLKVLEGKYDWSKNGDRSGVGRGIGPGQRFDPATAGGAVEGW